jgi:hypothetical protein
VLSVIILVIILSRRFKEPISNFLGRLIGGWAGRHGIGVYAIPPTEQHIGIEVGPQLPSQAEIEKFIAEDRLQQVSNAYIQLYQAYEFERILHAIYGTQLNLLEHLERRVEGVSYASLAAFYSYFKERWKLLSTAVPPQMEVYLGFLKSKHLIEYVGEDIVRITPDGSQFLSYIRNHYPYTYKFKPL